MLEPDKYQHLLEFQYLCLSLGFKGQYSLVHDGAESVQDVLNKLHKVLREKRGESPTRLLRAVSIKARKYKLTREFPLWGVWVIMLIGLSIAFFIYDANLSEYSDKVLANINTILEKWSVR